MREYAIVIGPLAEQELRDLRAFDHRAILDAIARQLTRDPLSRSKTKKPLAPPPAVLVPELQELFNGTVPEAWQLRVGDWRIVYIVAQQTVYVLRVVHKGRRTTDQALS